MSDPSTPSTSPSSATPNPLRGALKRGLNAKADDAKAEMTTPRSTDRTPVSIRSAGLRLIPTDASVKVKKPPSFFKPNLKPVHIPSASSSGGSTPGGCSTPTAAGSFVDIAAMLAHSLAMKNAAAGGVMSRDDLRKRWTGPMPMGAVKSRGAGAKGDQSLQQKVQLHLQHLKKKKDPNKRSMNLLELSWADGSSGLSTYTPISLPYILKEVDTNDEGDADSSGANQHQGGGSQSNTKRPTVKFIDEVNRNAASIFAKAPEDEDEFDHLGNWILVQLPSVLPALNRAAMEEDRKQREEGGKEKKEKGAQPSHQSTDDDQEEVYAPSTLSGTPEGKLGVLQIRKSGRVKLKVGKHLFDVNQGSDCNFYQEVGCYLEGNSEIMFLGRCNKRMVITPDIQHYIPDTSRTPHSAVGRKKGL